MLPIELVTQLVVHHLQDVALTTAVREAVTATHAAELPLAPPVPRKPLRALNGRRLRGRPG